LVFSLRLITQKAGFLTVRVRKPAFIVLN
jgi:hypothetical protein